MDIIRVKESTVVCPAKDTSRCTLPLPSLDSVLRKPYSHTPILYIYDQKTSKYNSLSPPPSIYFDTRILKSSLSEVLVPFYPLAGRLKINEENGKFEIDCNAKGVLFIEAETAHILDDFGDFSPSNELRKVAFPSTCDYSKGLSSFPLLIVQLTRFKCGGVTLGSLAHHHVHDGFAMSHFVNSWSRLAKGMGLAVMPFHDRLSCLGPRNPPQVKFRHLEYETPSPPTGISEGNLDTIGSTTTICNMFKFYKDQVSALKLKATSKDLKYKLSTYAVVAAQVWRSVCKARALPNNQEVRLYIPINGRTRLKDPNLPQGYFGNVLFRAICIAKASDVKTKPLWYIASKVQESLSRMDNEYLRSAIDYLALHPELTSIEPSFTWIDQERSPNLSINSWVNAPFYEADFGWGRPKYFRPGGVGFEGQTLIMSDEDGSLLVSINLRSDHMMLFKKYIYDISNTHSSL